MNVESTTDRLSKLRERFEIARGRTRKNRSVVMVGTDEFDACYAYVVPGLSQPVTPEELETADYFTRKQVALSWFLANHLPNLDIEPSSIGRTPENGGLNLSNITEWLHVEFDGQDILGAVGIEIEDQLHRISGQWKVAEAPAAPDAGLHSVAVYSDHLVRCIEALEVSLSAVTNNALLGHNHTNEDLVLPLGNLASIRNAADLLKAEARKDTPDVAAAEEAIGTLRRAYDLVGPWLLKKLDKGADEVVKWGVPLAIAYALNLFQRLEDVLNAAAPWMQALVGG